jgi:hypothetical protein
MLRLIVSALGIPLALTMVFLIQQLLLAMQDDAGALFLRRCGLILLALWGASLVALLIVTALRQIRQGP